MITLSIIITILNFIWLYNIFIKKNPILKVFCPAIIGPLQIITGYIEHSKWYLIVGILVIIAAIFELKLYTKKTETTENK